MSGRPRSRDPIEKMEMYTEGGVMKWRQLPEPKTPPKRKRKPRPRTPKTPPSKPQDG